MKQAIVAVTLALAALSGCATEPAAEQAERSVEALVIRSFVGAFNNRDADAMAGYLAEDIKWLSVAGDKITIVSEGRDAIRDEMRAHFEGSTEVSSTITGIEQTGPHLVTVETAHWQGSDGTAQAQSSISVYEIGEDGLIRHIWYFPEAR